MWSRMSVAFLALFLIGFGSVVVAADTETTVVAWGYRTGPGDTMAVPDGLTGVTAISAGQDYALALKTDGTVVAWGINWLGVATPPAGLSGVTAIAAGNNHALALKTDGTVVAWGGSNNSGQTTVPVECHGVAESPRPSTWRCRRPASAFLPRCA